MSPYTPTNWVDGATPLNRTGMKNIEDELVVLDGRLPVPTVVNGQWLKGVGGAAVWSALTGADISAAYGTNPPLRSPGAAGTNWLVHGRGEFVTLNSSGEVVVSWGFNATAVASIQVTPDGGDANSLNKVFAARAYDGVTGFVAVCPAAANLAVKFFWMVLAQF